MSVELWFLAILVMTQLYDRVAGPRFERLSRGKKFDLGMAIFFAIAIAGLSLGIYKYDIYKFLTFKNPQLALQLVGFVICYEFSYLGTKYWIKKRWWWQFSVVFAVVLTMSFFAKPNFIKDNIVN